MNIMILVISFPPKINAAANLYFELSESLKKNGHNITVITSFPVDDYLDDYLIEKVNKFRNKLFLMENINGINVFRVSNLSFLSKVPGGKALRYILSCLLFAIRGIFIKKPDVILVYSSPLYMGLSGYIISKIKKTQFVFNMQDIHPRILIDLGFVKNRNIIKLLLKMEDFIYKKANKFIVYSKGNKDYLIQKGVESNKIFIVPNWVDTGFIIPQIRMNEFRKVNNLNDKFIVLYSGSIRSSLPLKNIIDAAEILKSQKDIVFLLVGGGDYKSFLQRIITEKNIDNVFLLPFQPKEKYITLLNASDVNLLPVNKNAPLQIVPGKLPYQMACGRPIISMANLYGDTAKIIEKAKCGFCVEPEDPKKLSQSILVLFKDKELREAMGKNARIYAEQEFSRDICVRKYEEVLFLSSYPHKNSWLTQTFWSCNQIIQKNKIKTIKGYRMYSIDALPKYIKRYSSYLLIYHFKFLPESSLKRKIRKFLLNFYNSVPLFLALNKGDIAIEVGCPNVRTLRRYAHYVGSEGKVFIIEAEKENQDILLEAKEKLGLKNVTIIPFAAWSEKKKIEFLKSDQWKGDHKIPISDVLVDNDYVNTYTSVKVQTDTLDNLLHNKNIRTFNYLCVTVNGAELEVLRGAKELIAASSKCRIFSKGHNLINGVPLNRLIKKYLEGFDGYQVIISKGEASISQQENWKRRAGDVFAWKN